MQCVKVLLNKDDDKVKSSFSRAMKSIDNVNAMLQSIRSSNLLPLHNPPNAVLQNEFTKEVATTDQQYSLLNYRKLGQEIMMPISTRHLWCMVSPPMGRFQSAEMAGPF